MGSRDKSFHFMNLIWQHAPFSAIQAMNLLLYLLISTILFPPREGRGKNSNQSAQLSESAH